MRATPAAIASGSVGQRRLRCGVATTVRVPACTARAGEGERGGLRRPGPSSMPGSAWKWRSIRRSVCAAAREDGRQRREQDLDVARERPARHVLVVEPDHVVERDVRAPGDLPRAGEPGAQVGAPRLPVLGQRGAPRRAPAGAGRRGSCRRCSTLSSCGASSSEKRRMRRPTRVIAVVVARLDDRAVVAHLAPSSRRASSGTCRA